MLRFLIINACEAFLIRAGPTCFPSRFSSSSISLPVFRDAEVPGRCLRLSGFITFVVLRSDAVADFDELVSSKATELPPLP